MDYSLTEVIKSMFQKHNELLNIWTHLIGMLCFIALVVFLIQNRQETIKIYEEIKSDFKDFHLSQDFKQKFSQDFKNFVTKIKTTAKNQNKNLSHYKDVTFHYINE